jgi:succinate dehydrogenase / fumarate reductase cytochrome b subunit
MTTMSTRRRATAWMTPRWRDPGWYAFVLNRFTGLILVAYLLAHFVVLSRLTAGPVGWDELLGLFGSRPFLVGDVLLVAAVIFHGLNGLRVILLTFGMGNRRSGLMFGVVLVASAGLAALAAWGILLA